MHLLVTGGCGYVGSHFVRSALQQGHSVDVIDSLVTGHPQALPPHSALRLIESDVADPRWESALTARPDAAFHFAGFIEVAESVAQPDKYQDNNVARASHWLEITQDVGINNVVFSSTAAVYGIPDKSPVAESAPTTPINPYGVTKLEFENTLRTLKAKQRAFNFVALRYFNAAGASLDGEHGEAHCPESHLIPRAIRAALTGSSFTVNGTDYATADGTCIRDYVHIDDLARAHLAALALVQAGQSTEINLGSGRGNTVLEVLAAVEKYTRKKLKIAHGARRAGDPLSLVADNSRARQILNWKPELSLDEIIESAVRWHTRHPEGYR